MKIQKSLEIVFNTNVYSRYLVEMLALVPFIAMIATGIIMLRYHISENDLLIINGLDKHSWLLFHKISSLSALFMVIWHLLQHVYWLKNLFTRAPMVKHKKLNMALFIVFTLAVISATFSWLIIPDTPISAGLKGIHSKLGFATVILFILHIKNYFSFLKNMTYKMFIHKIQQKWNVNNL